MAWHNDYIGIQYKEKGRTREEGLDCWGLVRLVQKEQFNNELPSFVEQQTSDEAELEELFATQREGWVQVQDYKEGDVILFKVMGFESHVGTYIGDGKFLNISQGRTSVIERLDSSKWERRIVGAFRYQPNAVAVSAVPHPLKTQRVDCVFSSDLTLHEIEQRIKLANNVPQEIETNAIIMVDGKVIPKDQWFEYKPLHGQRVEYRSVAGKEAFKAIIVVVAIVYLGPIVGSYLGTTFGMTAATAAAVGSAVVSVAASYLVNAIFPTRLPELPSFDAGAKSQNLLQGGTNNANPYGAIPLVLGKVKFTPPVGAINYAESGSTTSYLRMLLVWGYGDLSVSDLRVGDTKLTSYESIKYETINDYQTESGNEISRFNSIYGKDVSQDAVGIELISDGTSGGSPWREQVLSDQCDSISVALYFPEGLRRIALDGDNAGKAYDTPFRAQIQYRQLDPDTLAPLTDWGDIREKSKQTTLSLSSAWFNIDSDAEKEKVYRWTRFTFDEDCNIKRYDGSFTASQYSNPSGSLLARLQDDTYGFNTTFDRLPAIEEGEEELWQVCVYGNDIVQTIDRRDASITGCNLTYSGLKATIAAGSIVRADADTVSLGSSNQFYYKRKDAFTYVRSFDVAKGKYEVRVRRTNDSEDEYTTGGVKYKRYHKAYYQSVTGFENIRPVVAPKGVKLCMTALRVKATDQLNGQIDGITGTVQSVCPDYDSATGTWITRPTRNPASLFRYVLQHPANAQKVSNSKINLDDLEVWHSYCKSNKFMFDMVITQQRSLFDVMRDICAAGRSSPTMRDGKWTVITDKPQSAIAQYFTPHNSWGFEGVRSLPKLPHAFRVQFNNSQKSYQPDEMIVYNDGYSAANATMFESLAFPGVTTKDQIFKHARFHFAQLKLRPETYTINADLEHLICTRGDLVKVTHDIPMWGLGTGRIKDYVDSNTLELDEAMPMDAGVQYTIRIRLEDGTSVTRTVAAKGTDGYYTTIDLTSTLTSTQGKAGNLFMFGSLSEETVTLLVQSIEPSDNMSARITLVDYSPAIYDSDDEVIPDFDSQITLPPLLQQQKITQVPTIGQMVSDESVMVRLAPNSYEYKIKVNFSNPTNLNKNIKFIRAQIDFANDKIQDWEQTTIVDVKARSVIFGDVQEGEDYKIRMRYESEDGRTAPWVTSSTHTVVGKSNPPAQVGRVTGSVSGTKIILDWADNKEPDLEYYEVRLTNSGWGDSARVYRGASSTCIVEPSGLGVSRTWYVRAVDGGGNYSTTSSTFTYTVSAPNNVSSVTSLFADTALTNATITIDWNDVLPVFGLKHYEITYDSVVKTTSSSTITLPANWIGNRNYVIKTVDNRGNKSSGYTYQVTKLAPNSPTNFRAQVIDNNVMLYWNLPTKTSLPIDHCLLKRGSTWATATVIGDKKGAFTTVNERAAGLYTYWIATVDTDDNESTPISIGVQVAEPPDFIFHGEFTSDFTATKSSAFKEDGYVVMPVNLTDTFQEHFDNNSWSTPQDQIDAGYPIYIQPANGSGYYEETFDFGTILASSKITINYAGEIVAGTPNIEFTLSYSIDDITYTDLTGVTQAFATNFRYIKVRATVTEDDGLGVYKLTDLNVRLDAKQISDSGSVSCVSTDTDGTLVNFNKEFIDVTSIVVSPSGTTPTTAVYDFQDANLSATYAVSSNVCTVTATAHGLIVGQNIRLAFSSGNGIDGIYTITNKTVNTFKVAMVVANTSGNCLAYPEGFRIYLFNSSGTRVDGVVSWSIKGY